MLFVHLRRDAGDAKHLRNLLAFNTVTPAMFEVGCAELSQRDGDVWSQSVCVVSVDAVHFDSAWLHTNASLK